MRPFGLLTEPEDDVISPEKLAGELERADIATELLARRVTMMAGEEVAALELPRAELAKTLVLATNGGSCALCYRHQSASTCTRNASCSATARNPAYDRRGARKRLPDGRGRRRSGVRRSPGRPNARRPPARRSTIEAGWQRASVRIATRDLTTVTGAELADLGAG
jgi:prolyl-tRNA editing enzyme YbaK/EbsC (Cys-tRNA(Pro) deacylase)